MRTAPSKLVVSALAFMPITRRQIPVCGVTAVLLLFATAAATSYTLTLPPTISCVAPTAANRPEGDTEIASPKCVRSYICSRSSCGSAAFFNVAMVTYASVDDTQRWYETRRAVTRPFLLSFLDPDLEQSFTMHYAVTMYRRRVIYVVLILAGILVSGFSVGSILPVCRDLGRRLPRRVRFRGRGCGGGDVVRKRAACTLGALAPRKESAGREGSAVVVP